MRPRKRTVHGKPLGATIEQWSTDETNFPFAWTEALERLNGFKTERVIGFRLKVYLASGLGLPRPPKSNDDKD